MNVLVTGSTGFIGSALVSFLADQGHDVTRLVRVRPTPGDRQVHWDPEAGTIDADRLAGTEAAVHLAGENLANKRWTSEQKARIRGSRAKGTRLLSETLARLDPPPTVLACASAQAYYGHRGDEVLSEESAPGSDFLAEVIQQWEAASGPVAHAGIRVVNLRFGMVLGANGGLLARMLTPFKLGVGGRLGSGKQYMSWISLQDALRAIHSTLTTPTLEGPVNVVAPGAVTNAEFTRTLGRLISRPTMLPVPAFALRAIFGEVVKPLLASTRMERAKVLAAGFEFRHPELEGALRAALVKY